MIRRMVWISVLLALATCSSATAPAGVGGATVTFTRTGVTPREVSVNRTSRVTFVNEDTRPHRPASDPHPDHTICPELNLATLQPGDRVESADLVNARDCMFHDDLSIGDERFSGRVLVGIQ